MPMVLSIYKGASPPPHYSSVISLARRVRHGSSIDKEMMIFLYRMELEAAIDRPARAALRRDYEAAYAAARA
eukprot:CAMPEP_0119408568 /NCGR_PEP_ID=MMETSP1335-20130426/2096_1 /TAXON_ID=259385 /ORGANISM="Chrysoculter rhomboideus, Strain RCC1486" /LENGTH=71 /DNA_ID=CAMNT_0007432833 /DNA_START=36 /DNA_END=248 /DNA_ORIENTATION=-